MKPQNVTITFSRVRLGLIEEALKKSEGMFSHQHRRMVRNTRRQVQVRLGKEKKPTLRFGDPLVTQTKPSFS